MKGKFFNYSINNVHALTEEKEYSEKDAFYWDLENCIQECPKNDIKIIVGDLNAKIG